jgi:uncharacterized protein (TIGR02147 family)
VITVFDYTDYRKYLEDYYQEKKRTEPEFSYQHLAEKAGFNNRGFIYLIVKGKRSISKTNCFKISQALEHNKYEAEYFENCVAFNQAKGLKEKNHFFERLCSIKEWGKGYTRMQRITRAQFEFYATWYHSAVRSIIDMYPFKDDYRWLAQMVTPSITATQARHSVQLLEKLGMIQKQDDGTYALTEKNITTGPEVTALAVQNFHIKCTDLAKRAIQTVPNDERNITGLTMGISPQAYDKLCTEIRAFQDRIAEIVDRDTGSDRVYQMNFHLFPLSSNTTPTQEAEK